MTEISHTLFKGPNVLIYLVCNLHVIFPKFNYLAMVSGPYLSWKLCGAGVQRSRLSYYVLFYILEWTLFVKELVIELYQNKEWDPILT